MVVDLVVEPYIVFDYYDLSLRRERERERDDLCQPQRQQPYDQAMSGTYLPLEKQNSGSSVSAALSLSASDTGCQAEDFVDFLDSVFSLQEPFGGEVRPTSASSDA